MTIALSLLSVSLTGQVPDSAVVSGIVTDLETGEPVPSATVVLDSVVQMVVGNDGQFRLVGLTYGVHTLEVRRVGYGALVLLVTVADPALTLTVPLTPVATPLDPLRVAAQGGLAGFYTRRDLGFGQFVTRDEFSKWNPAEIVDVLRHLSGVRVRANPTYGFDGDTRRYVVETRRGGDMTTSPSVLPECPVWYWRDGVPVGNAVEDPIDSFVAVDQLEAVESYVGVQVPPQFFHAQARCGVIAFWTRQDANNSVQQGRTSVWGGALGAGLGVTLGLVSPSSCRRCLFPTERLKRSIANGIVLGLVGALVWRFLPTPTTRYIAAPTLRSSPSQQMTFEVGARLRF